MAISFSSLMVMICNIFQDRHSKDTKVDFSILGGLEHDTGIFISKVCIMAYKLS